MSVRTHRKVVCFDLGGVLVRICRSWSEACGAAGLPERALSPEWLERRSRVVASYERGELDCTSYYTSLSECLERAYSPVDIERIHAAWTREEYPGAADLVRALNALEGMSTACLSNTNRAHWQRLSGEDGQSEYPTVRALRYRLASHRLGCLKPRPEIYALAHSEFARDGELGADDVTFFDDLEDNVRAARAFGWQAFQVDPSADPVAQMRQELARSGILG